MAIQFIKFIMQTKLIKRHTFTYNDENIPQYCTVIETARDLLVLYVHRTGSKF